MKSIQIQIANPKKTLTTQRIINTSKYRKVMRK
jgi:hypothetical protein